jgi:radical SAM superfamily enzyme YgiQ (UPF0313 family)
MKQLSICLINPKFDPSYWGLDYTLPLYPGKKKCTMVTGALPHLAGLVPDHRVVLLDENVEAIDFAALERFDIVGVTGMIVQKQRMRQILASLRERHIFTVVGGAYASVDETFFDGLCDVLFTGEADETWPAFVEAFASGKNYENIYKQASPTDMTKLPSPRFDLLKVNRYASGALQFSRGCPFRCEFCDIIVTFGRKPRMKRPEQVLDELEKMRQAGFFSCFIVDDNFIGNKKAAKQLLRRIVAWQERHSFPLRLTTEASINLADDSELLELLYQANFRSVFIGIETPRQDSLIETKKFQNTVGDSLEAKLARIRDAGLEVSAGFIVGFDHDDAQIFEDQFRFIQENGILLAMVGMLVAVPKTPLYDRLEKAGRLRLDDPNCNIVPAQMSAAELRAGYLELLRRLYTPGNFLERYFHQFRQPQFHLRRSRIAARSGGGNGSLKTLLYGLVLAWNLFRTLRREESLKIVGGTYLHYFFRDRRRYLRGVSGFAQFLNRCAVHWHFYKFTREMSAGRLRLYNSG